MKIDCSITENYFKGKNRMTKECTIDCIDCPLSDSKNGIKITCGNYQNKYILKAVQIVQQWSDEHPIKTNLDDFGEKYPKARLSDSGLPFVGPCKLSYRDNMECNDCPGCKAIWNQPYKGE